MAKPDPYAIQYRQWRNFIGLALGALWIVFWWIRFSTEESAALAGIAPAETLLGHVGHWWDTNSVAGDYAGYKMLAVFSSPLSFVVARYVARWHVDRLRRAKQRQAEAAQARQLTEQAADLERIRAAALTDAEKSQRANDRHELITRIGDVDSQLLVFEAETNAERRTRMLLNLTQFIYEIHAKFPADKLAMLLSGDEVLPQMIAHTLTHMRKLGLQDRNFYLVLSGMLPAPPVMPVADATADNFAPAKASSALAG